MPGLVLSRVWKTLVKPSSIDSRNSNQCLLCRLLIFWKTMWEPFSTWKNSRPLTKWGCELWSWGRKVIKNRFKLYNLSVALLPSLFNSIERHFQPSQDLKSQFKTTITTSIASCVIRRSNRAIDCWPCLARFNTDIMKHAWSIIWDTDPQSVHTVQKK